MKPTPLRALALLVVLAAVAVAGAATPAEAGALHGKRTVILRAAATYIGVTPRALVAELRTGKSLAQVATANGKTVAGLKQAILAAVDARLSRAVAAGRITAEQKSRRLARFESRLDRFVNRVWRAR
jgi:hypothetical protein